MTDLASKSIYHTILTILTRALLGAGLAVGAVASPLFAQNIVGGNFTLNESTRFGSTVLGAGQYRFSIEPVGHIQSMRSIQEGAGHLVLVVLRPEKNGPGTSIFAMASPSDRSREGNELILRSQRAETLAQTMYLEKDGIMVDFNWASPKGKGQAIAQQQVMPVQAATAASRAGGTN